MSDPVNHRRRVGIGRKKEAKLVGKGCRALTWYVINFSMSSNHAAHPRSSAILFTQAVMEKVRALHNWNKNNNLCCRTHSNSNFPAFTLSVLATHFASNRLCKLRFSVIKSLSFNLSWMRFLNSVLLMRFCSAEEFCLCAILKGHVGQRSELYLHEGYWRSSSIHSVSTMQR